MTATAHLNTPRVAKGTPTGGEWRPKDHSDPGLIDLSEPSGLDTDPTTGPEFEWDRIESLMGDDFHLDPNRTASIPVMKIDDDVAQMTRKVMNYVAKTQSIDGMTDEQVAALVGLTAAPDEGPMPSELRRSFDVPADERIVVAIGRDGRITYLSASGVFKRTGTFRSRNSGHTYNIENIAPQIVAERYRVKFAEQHPEFDQKDVDEMFRRLADKSITGKGYKHLWDESLLPPAGAQVLGATMVTDFLTQHPGADVDANELIRSVTRMDADEIRARFANLPVGETLASTGGFIRMVPAYQASLGTMKLAVRQDVIEASLAGETPQAKRAAMNRAYRAFLEEELAIEYDYQRQRTYIRDANASHSATVFEQKRNVPATHLHAAETGYFKSSGDFRHVEIDADTDLERLRQVEQEYANLRRHLPKTAKEPTLRFRKTGRHHALGVYHPHADNIAVDPRHPSSFLHEFVHHIDHTAGDRNISSGDEFRPLLRAVQSRLSRSTSQTVRKKLDYYQTPTEVLSRTAEVYFHWKSPGYSLNGDDAKYTDDAAYAVMEPLRDQIISFWDKQLGDMGVELPASPAQRVRVA